MLNNHMQKNDLLCGIYLFTYTMHSMDLRSQVMRPAFVIVQVLKNILNWGMKVKCK